MSRGISTRRCLRANTPCQQIQNVFNLQENHHLSLVPDHVRKLFPSTQKVSCEVIEKMHQLFPKHSNEETLKQLRDNVRLMHEEISKITGQQLLPDNASFIKTQTDIRDFQQQVKSHETPIRKQAKKENCTRSVSDCESLLIRDNDIFADQQVIQKLQDYLAMD